MEDTTEKNLKLAR